MLELSFKNKYYVYIVTDKDKAALTIGISGNLDVCLQQLENTFDKKGKPVCAHLLYWEEYESGLQALAREEELNKLPKKKKEALVTSKNPEWRILNAEIYKTAWASS